MTGPQAARCVHARQSRQRPLSQLFAIQRFDQQAVHAGLKAGVAVFHQLVCSQRQDRRLRAGLAGLSRSFPRAGARCRRAAASGYPPSAPGHTCSGRQPAIQRFLAIGGDDGKVPQPRYKERINSALISLSSATRHPKPARRRDRHRCADTCQAHRSGHRGRHSRAPALPVHVSRVASDAARSGLIR